MGGSATGASNTAGTQRATKQEMFRITADNTFSFGKGVLEESFHYDTGGGIQGNYNHSILDYGEIFYGYTNAVANFTFNVRGNTGRTYNDITTINKVSTVTAYIK